MGISFWGPSFNPLQIPAPWESGGLWEWKPIDWGVWVSRDLLFMITFLEGLTSFPWANATYFCKLQIVRSNPASQHFEHFKKVFFTHQLTRILTAFMHLPDQSDQLLKAGVAPKMSLVGSTAGPTEAGQEGLAYGFWNRYLNEKW